MDQIIVFCAKYLFAAGPVLIALVWLRLSNLDRRSLFLRTITVGILCAGLAYVAGQAYYDQRPFVRLHIEPLIAHVADNGFPSDHTMYTAACAFVLFPYSRVPAVLAGIAALGVAWARVACLLHSPIDVIAAILLAALAAAIGKILVRRRPNDRGSIPRIGRAPRPSAAR